MTTPENEDYDPSGDTYPPVTFQTVVDPDAPVTPVPASTPIAPTPDWDRTYYGVRVGAGDITRDEACAIINHALDSLAAAVPDLGRWYHIAPTGTSKAEAMEDVAFDDNHRVAPDRIEKNAEEVPSPWGLMLWNEAPAEGYNDILFKLGGAFLPGLSLTVNKQLTLTDDEITAAFTPLQPDDIDVLRIGELDRVSLLHP